MSVTAYFLSNNAEGTLTGGGAQNKKLETAPAAGTWSPAVGTSTTVYSSFFSPSGDPGVGGLTGLFYIAVDITVGNTNALYNVVLNRVNSSGVVQTTATGTETTVGTSGTYFFKFAGQSLGTWASGDRLRIDVKIRNSSSMTAISAGGVTYNYGSPQSAWASLPWNPNILADPEAQDSVNWSASGGGLTANATTAPDGNATSEAYTENTSSTLHGVAPSTSPKLPADAFVFAGYIKPGTRTSFAIQINTTEVSSFDLTTATPTPASGYTAGAYAAQNGFYRIYASKTFAAGVTGTRFGGYSGGTTYLGTSATFSLWGLTCEPGSEPSAYTGLATSGSTAINPLFSKALATVGPFKSAGGNYYLFGRASNPDIGLVVAKASDPTSTWSAVGTPQLTSGSLTIQYVSAYQVADVIHLLVTAANASTAVSYFYYQFNMATDTWSITGETVQTAIDTRDTATNARYTGGIVVRSGGNVVLHMQSARTASGGASYARTSYRIRTGANTYGTLTAVSPTGANDYDCQGAAIDTADRVYLPYHAYGPSSGQGGKTLNASNTLTAVNLTVGATTVIGFFDSTVFANSGDKYIYAGGGTAFAGSAIYGSAADGITTASSQSADTGASFTALVGPARVLADGANIYIVGGTPDNAANPITTLYAYKSTDSGANFAAKVSMGAYAIPASIAGLSRDSKVYLRGSNYVIPLVANDNGTLKYIEYTVRTSGPQIDFANTLGAVTLSAAATNAEVISAPITLGAVIASSGSTHPDLLDSSITLGAVTSSSGSTHPDLLDSAKTLGAVTVSSTILAAEALASSVTLGADTASATATAAEALTATITTGAVTSSSGSTHPDALDASITLGAVTSSSGSTHPDQLDSSITLGAVTAASTLAAAEKLDSSITLATVTDAGTMTAAEALTSSITLAGVTASATATGAEVLASSITLGAVTSSSTSTHPDSLDGSITLGAVTSSSTSTHPDSLDAALQIAAVTASATAAAAEALTSSITLDGITASATATVAEKLDSSITLGGVTSTAALTVAENLDASITLDATSIFWSSATGFIDASFTLGAVTGAATMTAADKTDASIAAASVTVAATASVAASVNAAITLSPVTTAGTAAAAEVLTSSITLGAATAAADLTGREALTSSITLGGVSLASSASVATSLSFFSTVGVSAQATLYGALAVNIAATVGPTLITAAISHPAAGLHLDADLTLGGISVTSALATHEAASFSATLGDVSFAGTLALTDRIDAAITLAAASFSSDSTVIFGFSFAGTILTTVSATLAAQLALDANVQASEIAASAFAYAYYRRVVFGRIRSLRN
jgi:hypothetical protein